MLLVLEIGMFIAGIVALIRGKLHLTRTVEVEGTPARVVGLIWLLPFPLAFGIGFLVASMLVASGKPVDSNSLGPLVLIEVGLILVFFIIGIVVAVVNGNKPRKRRRRDEEDDEDDEDFPLRKKRRRRVEEVEEVNEVEEEVDELEEVEEVRPVRPESKPAAAPTSIQVQCPGCKSSYRLPASLAGKKARCKDCQTVFAVEEAAQRGIQATPPRPLPRSGTKEGPGGVKKRPEREE